MKTQNVAARFQRAEQRARENVPDNHPGAAVVRSRAVIDPFPEPIPAQSALTGPDAAMRGPRVASVEYPRPGIDSRARLVTPKYAFEQVMIRKQSTKNARTIQNVYEFPIRNRRTEQDRKKIGKSSTSRFRRESGDQCSRLLKL
jgi:hypothetical protein